MSNNPPLYRDFILGGTATTLACLFTNPLEVVKVRLQLQGELALSSERHYRGVFHSFLTIVQHEGIKGIQKGLAPAMLYQFTMNGCRLGGYQVLKQILGTTDAKGSDIMNLESLSAHPGLSLAKNMGAAATAGAFSAFVGSPFFLVKIRMQSQSDFAQVGQQYNYRSTWQALKTIQNESGWKGLMRGVDAAMIRVAMGSSVQLPSYDISKRLIVENTNIKDGTIVYFLSSLVAGASVVLAMNPFDVVSTRLYNEKVQGGKGVYYTGPFDCFLKTLTKEGVMGLYKGSLAHYFRIGPHSVLTFVFLEQLKNLAAKFGVFQ